MFSPIAGAEAGGAGSGGQPGGHAEDQGRPGAVPAGAGSADRAESADGRGFEELRRADEAGDSLGRLLLHHDDIIRVDFYVDLVPAVDDLLVGAEVGDEGVEPDLALTAGLEAEDEGVGRALENLLRHCRGEAVVAGEGLVLELDLFRPDGDKDFPRLRDDVGGGQAEVVAPAELYGDEVVVPVGDGAGKQVGFADEGGDELGFGPVVQVVNGPELLDLALVHQGDPV